MKVSDLSKELIKGNGSKYFWAWKYQTTEWGY